MNSVLLFSFWKLNSISQWKSKRKWKLCMKMWEPKTVLHAIRRLQIWEHLRTIKHQSGNCSLYHSHSWLSQCCCWLYFTTTQVQNNFSFGFIIIRQCNGISRYVIIYTKLLLVISFEVITTNHNPNESQKMSVQAFTRQVIVAVFFIYCS